MLPDKNIMCPATGFAKSCRSIVSDVTCPKFVRVEGVTPDTGVKVDNWGCVDSFLPWLLIQNAQMSRQTGAAVEDFRNKVMADREEQQAAIARAAIQFQGGDL